MTLDPQASSPLKARESNSENKRYQMTSSVSTADTFSSSNTTIRDGTASSSSSSANNVYPLSKPYFQTHRYNPKDLEPTVLDKQGTSVCDDTDDSVVMDYSPTRPRQHNNDMPCTSKIKHSASSSDDSSYILHHPTFHTRTSSDTTPTPSSYHSSRTHQTQHEDIKNIQTPSQKTSHWKANQSHHGRNGNSIAENGQPEQIGNKSIFPQTPPMSHRASKMFDTAPPPMPSHLPTEFSYDTLNGSTLTSGSAKKTNSITHPPGTGPAPPYFPPGEHHHQNSITSSITSKLYQKYARWLQVAFAMGFLAFPFWMMGGMFARLKIRPHMLELEGDHHFFGTGSPPFRLNHRGSIYNQNEDNWAPFKDKKRIEFWVVVLELCGMVGLVLSIVLPILLGIFLSG